MRAVASADSVSHTSQSIWIHALGAKAGGGITYLRSVLPELFRQLQGTGTRVVLMLPAELPGVPIPEWCEVRVYPFVAYNAIGRLLFDHVVLPLQLRGRRKASLFCSGSFPPLFKSIRTIVLVRNAIYFEQDFLRREEPLRRLLFKLQGVMIRYGARRCDAVHYPSRYMRQLAEDGCATMSARGVLNYYGIARRLVDARGEEPPPHVTPAGWTTFLYVMNYTLQKNLGFLLRALARAHELRLKVRVVVTSDLHPTRRTFCLEDRALIHRHDLVGAGYLVPLGHTDGEDLVRLYHQLDACIFPSICESFGHPLVEALALGKPIICADRPYAREICGQHALYVDPDRPEDLVDVWRRWPEAAASIPTAQLADLTSMFSWQRHVSRLLEDLLDRQAV